MHRDEETIEIYNDPTESCRVCGLLQPEPQYGEAGDTPTFDICDCCGVEFGYEDSTLVGIRNYRQNWVAGGCIWKEPSQKPLNWSLETQLKKVRAEYL